MREVAQHGFALFYATGGIRFAHDDVRAGFVCVCIEVEEIVADAGPARREPHELARSDHLPAGDDVGEAGDVCLVVAAVCTHGMQFENFPRQVLVQAGRRRKRFELLRAFRRMLRPLGMRPDAARVVEVDQHRGMLRNGEQHVLELAGDVRADRIALERGRQRNGHRFRAGNDEVVRPEVDEAFEHRRVRCYCGVEARLHGSLVSRIKGFDVGFLHTPLHCLVIGGLDFFAVVAQPEEKCHLVVQRRWKRGKRGRKLLFRNDLTFYPELRIRRDCAHCVGVRTEAEAVRGDDGVLRDHDCRSERAPSRSLSAIRRMERSSVASVLTHETLLHRRSDQRAVGLVDFATAVTARLRRRRAVEVVEQPLVDADRAVEPQRVVEAGALQA